MNRNREIIIGVIVVVIVVAGYFVFAGMHKGPAVPAANAPVGTQTDMGTVTQSGVVAASGTSAVASSGVVVARSGQATENSVAPGTPTAPQESVPVASTAVPKAAIKLTVTVSGGFSPNTFTVSAGAPVSVAITSGDQYSHTFVFSDPSLSAVAVGVAPGETRVITFNAPTKAGTYAFSSNIPGQSGETGTMTVK